VEEFGSPLYIYSRRTVEEHWLKWEQALADLDHRVCFAVKANSNLAVINTLAGLGSGFDVVSAGELFRVKKAGGDSSLCTFAGVGKTAEEIEQAISDGIYSFNVESVAELELISSVATGKGVRAPVSVRVNPNVDAETHGKITTGTYENKFGIAFEEVAALYERASRMPGIWLRGVQIHIGSQITAVRPFEDAVRKMLPLVTELKARHGIEFFDIGGGVGIVYQSAMASGTSEWWLGEDKPLTPASYAGALVPLLRGLGLKIIVEPGRFIVGNAGILAAKVLYVKKTGKKRFVVVDAAMNDLIRPAFYDSYHEIMSVGKKAGQELLPTDVVGPICESGDFFCKNRPLPPFESGDCLALMSAGAYGFTMSSNYNSRPRAAEVMVSGKTVKLVRRRESFDDLIRGESFD